MNASDAGFEAVWGVVKAEIRKTRRREAIRRKVAAGTLCVVISVSAGIALLSGWREKTPVLAVPWQVAGVSAMPGVCPEYPVVRGEYVVMVNGEEPGRQLIGVRKSDGVRVWTGSESFCEYRISADDSRIYVLARKASDSWTLMAVDIRSGITEWISRGVADAASVPSMLAIAEGCAAWSEGGGIVCHSSVDGSRLWETETGSGIVMSPPVFANGRIFTASLSSVNALEASTGAPVWRAALDGKAGLGAPSRPLIASSGGRIYAAYPNGNNAAEGSIACFDAGDGSMIWRRRDAMPRSLAVAPHGTVLARASALSAFDAGTGRRVWTFPAGGCGPLAMDDNHVYAVDAREMARLIAVDLRNGAQAWCADAKASCNGVVIRDGMGFVSGNDGRLYAMNMLKLPEPGT